MIDITLLGFSLFILFYYFIIYSFIGWCLETIYATINKGDFVNRGFLHGPFCPIYGFGTLSIIVFLKPFENDIIFLFFGSILLTSLIEYITGYILETAFNSTWWDYSDEPFNIKGRICLVFSILWGFISIFILKIIHPHVANLVNLIPYKIGTILFYAILIYFLVDFVITVITVIKLKSLLAQLNSIYSDLIDRLSEFKLNVENTKDIGELKIKLEQLKENAEIKMSKKKYDIENILKELKTKYDALLIKKSPKYSRLIKAFPDLKFKDLEITLRDVKNKIHKSHENK